VWTYQETGQFVERMFQSLSFINKKYEIWAIFLCLKTSFFFKHFSKGDIQGLFDGCLFDICVNEGNEPKQRELRCAAYAKYNRLCLNIAANKGIRDWFFNWRGPTNCR
jgi:hypothetical protein